MLANLATALFEHNRITTTEAKAKRLRPLAERLITFAKRGDLHARRQVMTVIRDKDVVHKLFAEIGPNFANRPGGYTRILKVGPRQGDNAPMAIIELCEAMTDAQSVVSEAERARGTRTAARTAPTGRTAELAQEHKGDSATAAAVAAEAEAAEIEASEVGDAEAASEVADVESADDGATAESATDVEEQDDAEVADDSVAAGGEPEDDAK